MRFNNRAEICTLRSQTYPFSTTLHFRLHLPNVEMTLDLEVNEVEVKGLTSLGSVAWITGKESASLPGVDAQSIQAHHIDMCKFEDEDREGYKSRNYLNGYQNLPTGNRNRNRTTERSKKS
jgi:hypothetical protein